MPRFWRILLENHGFAMPVGIDCGIVFEEKVVIVFCITLKISSYVLEKFVMTVEFAKTAFFCYTFAERNSKLIQSSKIESLCSTKKLVSVCCCLPWS